MKIEQDQDGEDSDDELLNPRNFFNNMYQNDDFMRMKSGLENEIINQTKQEVERKHIIKDFDSVLADLDKWKEGRKKK
jgi:hypothetical protein